MNAKAVESRFYPPVVRPFDMRRPAAPSRATPPRGQRQLVEQSLLRCPRSGVKPRG
jgi:hypothetical protein